MFLNEAKKISWNVRGANDRDKRKVIKSLIKAHRAYVVCLQETKFQETTMEVVRSLGVSRCMDWGAIDARGGSRGVRVFWDKRFVEMLEMEVGQFSLTCHFKNCKDGFM